ncbi:MAG: 4-hydroxy-tetrahydrodipicolinate reductase, partial [Nitrospinota bacterium]|nr:4-hydroxy-tetrahydrodipicolinate reductase [Nitrospinota bacterium]
MKKINLAITGCLGRMGQQLIKSSKRAKNFKLVSITENRIINKKISGLRPQLNSESAFKKANIIIDFTIPKCTLEVLKIASKLKKRVVIGTTGFSKKEEKLIKQKLKKLYKDYFLNGSQIINRTFNDKINKQSFWSNFDKKDLRNV